VVSKLSLPVLCGWKLKVPRQVFACDMTSLHVLYDSFICVFVRVFCACVCVCVCACVVSKLSLPVLCGRKLKVQRQVFVRDMTRLHV